MNALAIQFDGVHTTQKDRQMSDNPDLSEWLTTAEAAVVMGVARQHVQYLCRDKTSGLECKKHGRDWMVNRASAENWKRKKSGRPKEE